MDIYHFTDTKYIWHVISSKATQRFPRIRWNPSDTLYTCRIHLVSGFTGILSKNQGGNTVQKHNLPCALCEEKNSKRDNALLYPPIYNDFSMFQHNCFNSREGGKCRFRTTALAGLDDFPLSFSTDLVVRQLFCRQQVLLSLFPRESSPNKINNRAKQKWLRSQRCSPKRNRHFVQKGRTGSQSGFPHSYSMGRI